MNLQPFADRLQAEAAAFKLVAVAGGLGEVLKNLPGQGANALIIPVADSAGPNIYGAGQVMQKITETFGVVIVARNAGGRRREMAAEDMGSLKDLAAAALIGWRHPDADGPTLYANGRMLSVQGSAAIWQSNFTATSKIRSQ